MEIEQTESGEAKAEIGLFSSGIVNWPKLEWNCTVMRSATLSLSLSLSLSAYPTDFATRTLVIN